MNKRILITLGAPNNPEGILSKIARSRLDLCLKIHSKNDHVLCTGGWGNNFNTAPNPHAFYAKEYLINKGVPQNSFLDFALSGNTVEDAVKAKEIISKFAYPQLIIITSDFHLKRTKLIFKEILDGYTMEFRGAKTTIPEEQLQKIVEHEKQAIENIVKNGLYY